MKVESLRILSKKRKQSQRAEPTSGGAGYDGAQPGSNGKCVKRALPGGGDAARGDNPGHAAGCKSASASTPHLSKMQSGSLCPGGSSGSKDSQRRRFVWSEPLHQDFVAAVFDIGLKCASPKLLLEMMPVVDGLTSEHIKSHLQKYRLHRQRSREEFLKSYGYLTDLDGGKGLGGGSAAAAIKAAAAAAGGIGGSLDFKGGVPRSSAEGRDELGCDSSCACDGDAQMVSDGGEMGEKVKEIGRSKGSGEARQGPRAESEDSADLQKQTHGKASGEAGEGSAESAEIVTGPGPVSPGARALPVMTNGLFQSHLELLAKGIDMQIQFHHHLVEVVKSQKALQVQLLGRSGINSSAGSGTSSEHGGFASPTLASTAGMIRGAMQSTPMEQARVRGNNRLFAGHGRMLEMDVTGASKNGMAMQVTRQDTSVEDQAEVKNGKVKEPSALNGVRRQTERSVDPKRENGSHHVADMNPAVVAGTASPPASARADPTTHDASARQKTAGTNTSATNVESSPSSRFSLAAIRAAVSVRVDTSANPPRSAPLSLPSSTAAGRRAYVPGEYTLNTKSSGVTQTGQAEDGIPGLNGTTAILRVDGDEVGLGGSSSGCDTQHVDRAAEPALAAADGQDPRTLQRRMQMQMEMQRTMLEACVDQATLFKIHRACGAATGVVPMQTNALPTRDGAGAGEQGSREGRSRGGGIGDGDMGLTMVSRNQGAESMPSLQPADPAEPTPAAFMPPEDVLNFDWLDHGGELQQADATVPASQVEEAHSLFSFLTE